MDMWVDSKTCEEEHTSMQGTQEDVLLEIKPMNNRKECPQEGLQGTQLLLLLSSSRV